MKKLFIILLSLGLVACSSTEEVAPRPVNRLSNSMSLSQKELLDIIEEQNALFEKFKGDSEDKMHLSQMNTRYKKIISRWENYISQYPNDVDAIIIYGKFLRAVGEFDKAYIAFREVDKIDPSIAVVKQQLATFEGDFGMYKESLSHIKEAIELKNDEPIYYYQLAELFCVYYNEFQIANLYSSEQLNKLIEFNFKKAIELDPKNTHLYWRYAQSFYGLSDANWENALQAWQMLEAFVFMNIDKNNVLVNKARVLIELYRDSEAMEILESIDTPSLQQNKNRLISIIKAQEAGDVEREKSLKIEDSNRIKAESESELEGKNG